LLSYEKTELKTVSLGQKIDIVFDVLRIGYAFNDLSLIKKNIQKAHQYIEDGGDWERRNRLKVYEGLYKMWIRNFSAATKLFLDSVSTFTCNELLNFNQFIHYTIIMSMISLDRPTLKSTVIDSSDVLSVIRDLPNDTKYLNSLYECQYDVFLITLADITDQMKEDKYLISHSNFYSREMRIKGYAQFLEPYKSIRLANMAHNFGLSHQFLDFELSRFISSGRLHCKIDKVDGVIETVKLNEKNEHYQSLIKLGDSILNRVHKLSRVTDL